MKLELFNTVHDRVANSTELTKTCSFDKKDRKRIAQKVVKVLTEECEELYKTTDKYQVLGRELGAPSSL
jgi:phosphoribosyl-ATP pyrophosphohydrolase